VCQKRRPNLSQDDLAYEAEVSGSYLSQLEKGAFYASLKIVGKLAVVLGSRAGRTLAARRRGARAANDPNQEKCRTSSFDSRRLIVCSVDFLIVVS